MYTNVRMYIYINLYIYILRVGVVECVKWMTGSRSGEKRKEKERARHKNTMCII